MIIVKTIVCSKGLHLQGVNLMLF